MTDVRKLPDSGAISANAINLELKRSGTAAFSMNGSAERKLAGKPSGAISFHDFHGKSGETVIYEGVMNTEAWGPIGAEFGYKLEDGGSISPTKTKDGKYTVTGIWASAIGDATVFRLAGGTSTPPYSGMVKIKLTSRRDGHTHTTSSLRYQNTSFGWAWMGSRYLDMHVNYPYDVVISVY